MKPPYRVPSMAEIAAVKPNGFKVISTFAGAGGSSLGYRMAGFRILLASEFVPAAREVYAANAARGTIVDARDIRDVDPLELLRNVGLKRGELDVLDGSPPCASFSTAGKRAEHWGATKKYSDREQRTDDLFFEFIRFVHAMQPKVFVAENVSGLVKGVAKGYFLNILAKMKACGYRVEARLLDAQWLGVPQARQRIIFIGVRNDLDLAPAYPSPLPYRYSVRDALPWILRQGDNGGFGKGVMRDAGVPSPTIGAGPSSGNGRASPARVEVVHGAYSTSRAKRGENLDADAPAPTIVAGVHGGGPHQLYLRGAESIEGYAVGEEAKKLGPGETSDRYFQLKRAHTEHPSQTVTADGGDVTKASVMHPTEMRKFTIEELKRICAFPDDFVLTGTYAQQWERLGRAVPPVMMRAIAETVRDRILVPASARTPAPPRRAPDRSTKATPPTDAGTSRSRRRHARSMRAASSR